jgi:hypothetical protein
VGRRVAVQRESLIFLYRGEGLGTQFNLGRSCTQVSTG